ncbi:antifungsal 2 [Fusarium albosuccineum]|uniref:Antifungsal 2 n=2 Tax=Fusarium decemcellulare species complex TaxID=1329916 RepID=A0A8H4L646_9HYPO|nr:antifungsal 2 [Fusarium albosuccineum]KAF4986455.1 hypothetical protein FDECE_15942 [Fusarium decemcellulare]KAJ3530907.1 hypothetical protein NM208_g9111 [Fusarium decemcellulare]
MFFKTAIFSVFALLAANGAMGAALPEEAGDMQILIATDAYYACNCPNNCNHNQGSSCKFYSGPSDTDTITEGTCEYPNGNHLASLTCTA